MNKLEEIRLTLNDIDLKMRELFEQRMAAVKQVALYKKEHQLPILDETREQSLIDKNMQNLKDLELESFYLEFLKVILKVSKDYQKDLIQ